MTKIKYLLLLLFIVPVSVHAEETLETVLARMKPETATAIAYQEKRSMGLLDGMLDAKGYFYVSPPATLLKEQQNPSVEIMGADGDQLYYKAENRQVYQIKMDDSFPASQHIIAFNGLMNGDFTELERLYHLQFESDDKQWTITLIAKDYDKEEDEQPLNVIMQGLTGKVAHSMAVIEPDGDRSDFTLQPADSGEKAEQSIEKLLKHLQGRN